jgi:enoyl-CoA hydratase/carnithine racemase
VSVVRLELEGPLAVVSLARSGGNRISFAMRNELHTAINRVDDSDARALLIRADGPDFCLGGDVREWAGVPAAVLRPKIEVLATALDDLRGLDIPTVAAVQGSCVGGGFEIALSCDMIVAARSARFSSPEAQLGITTLQGGMLDLATRLGRTRAADLVFLATPASAEQMYAWNAVTTVVDDDALDHAARDISSTLSTGPTRAYAATKSLWRLQAQEGDSAARAALYDTSMPVFDTRDARVAVQAAAEAVSEGRPFPKVDFEGR